MSKFSPNRRVHLVGSFQSAASEADDDSFMHQLGKSELQAILDCGDLDELSKKFPHKIQQFKRILRSRMQRLPFSNHSISLGISDALTEAPSFPIVVLWTLAGIGTIGIYTVTMLTALFGSMTLIVGGLYFLSLYKEMKRERRIKMQSISLLEIKSECVKELIRRERVISQQANLPSQDCPLSQQRMQERRKLSWRNIRLTLESTMMVAATLLGTYYIAGNTVLAALGFTVAASAMVGPIGMAIAVVVCLAIGAFFGYKQYRRAKNEEFICRYHDKLEADLDANHRTYKRLAKANRAARAPDNTPTTSPAPDDPNNSLDASSLRESNLRRVTDSEIVQLPRSNRLFSKSNSAEFNAKLKRDRGKAMIGYSRR